MDVDSKKLRIDEQLGIAGGSGIKGSGDSEFNSKAEFDSACSGEPSTSLENSGNDNIRDELSGESVHLKGGLEIIYTRFDSKYRYYHAGVWGFDTMARPEELFGCLEKANRDIRLLYVFLERDHLHAIQDCVLKRVMQMFPHSGYWKKVWQNQIRHIIRS